MTFVNKKESLLLFMGDLLIFYASVFLALVFRFLTIPDLHTVLIHMEPFSILFIFWILFFYVAGLYKKHTLILKSVLPNILVKTQIFNIGLAIVFFYFIPKFSITPKTILFIYLLISILLIYVWRIYLFPLISKAKKQNALIIGNGIEMAELVHEINNNNRYNFKFTCVIDLDNFNESDLAKYLSDKVKESEITLVVADIKNKKIENALPTLYSLIFEKVEFVNFYDAYESIFDRVALSIMDHGWFIENISSKNQKAYDFMKRLMDIVIASVLFFMSLVFYPFVILAILIESKNNPFIIQERIGKDNKIIKIFKFRSMTSNDKGKWLTTGDNRVTKVGKILRMSRIDELPQLLNILKGDLSLVGPRPDIAGLFEDLRNKVSYYTIRNVVKPGLSGWAQTHQETPPQSIEETKIRLSYDLYYVKNCSFFLDFKIALQTLKTLISRTGK